MRPRPTTVVSLLALVVGLLLSPSSTMPTVEFDASFWDLSHVGDPTNPTIGSWQTLQSGAMMSRVTYFSETYGGSPVLIEALLYRPAGEGKFPAVILMHGSFGSAESMAYFGELLATKGYVALAVSGPGQGESTGPPETNENRLNTTDGPYYSYYYRLLYSAMRGITLLTELPFVDRDRIGATGASQGGLETLWLSALDDRVKAAVPIVAGGNFSFLVYQGSFASGHLPPGVTLTDSRGMLLMKYFDPLAYAARSQAPTLMLVGTSDEFFPIDSFNQTYSSLASEKAILMLPNTGHFVPKAEWVASAEVWFSKLLKGEGDFPEVSLVSVERNDSVILVKATGRSVDGMVLNFRDGYPWSRWETYPMNRTGQYWTVSLPLSAVDATVYVSGVVGGQQVVSSGTKAFEADATGSISTFSFVLCAFLVMLLVGVSVTMDWISALERAVVWSAIWSTTLLPLMIGAGAAPLSLWTIMRTFELWINPAVPFILALVLPAGALLAASSDRALKAMSVVSVLATMFLCMLILSYVTSRASLSLGMTMWAQLLIAVALLLEPYLVRGPAPTDRSIAALFKKKAK